MSKFEVHSEDTAPRESAELLGEAKKAFGFVPNLLGVFAESPAALNGYLTLNQIFEGSSFSPVERQVVILAISRFNECEYCVSAHSVIANQQEVPREVVEAIRNDEPIADSKLEALRKFTTAMLDKRGWVSEEDRAGFEEAGYNKAQMLEVILGISLKTLSNYTNHIADTPLDDPFEAKAWTGREERQTG